MGACVRAEDGMGSALGCYRSRHRGYRGHSKGSRLRVSEGLATALEVEGRRGWVSDDRWLPESSIMTATSKSARVKKFRIGFFAVVNGLRQNEVWI